MKISCTRGDNASPYGPTPPTSGLQDRPAEFAHGRIDLPAVFHNLPGNIERDFKNEKPMPNPVRFGICSTRTG
jgi:hypothetical protein